VRPESDVARQRCKLRWRPIFNTKKKPRPANSMHQGSASDPGETKTEQQDKQASHVRMQRVLGTVISMFGAEQVTWPLPVRLYPRAQFTSHDASNARFEQSGATWWVPRLTLHGRAA
jgi:hypothetical protein